MRALPLLLAAAAGLAQPPAIEERGAAAWPTRNHFRVRAAGEAPPGKPVWIDLRLPPDFNPDSVRVLASAGAPAPAKTEWRPPEARIAWRSTGAPVYHVYFDTGGRGETERLPEPVMIGAGDRLTYGRAGVRAPLAVGLWAYPAPLDFDGDGNLDLIVSCPVAPYNGTFLFRNLGGRGEPLFDRAEWLGPGRKEMLAADFNGDGAIDLVVSGGYFSDVRRHRLARFVPVKLPRDYHIGRDDLWFPVDWDRDGRIDVLAGVSDWRDYGWDDAFNEKGEWTRGPLHGYVWFHRNVGTNAEPVYAPPRKLEAAGSPIDRYGSPAPNPVDWFGSGRLDLLAGSFLDTVAVYRNTGPSLAAAAPVLAGGKPLRMDLCMIQPRVAVWRPDRGPSLFVAEEDGTVSLFENTAPPGQEPNLRPGRYLLQVDPYLKSGALSRPSVVDWNGDGRPDIISGNSAGYIQFFENTGTRADPVFADRGYLRAGGRVIRHMAGPNGSIQGPAEEKWGYTNPWAADWDLDGLPDILVNDIWGKVVWYRNSGARTRPELAPAAPVEVEWPGKPPKPEWNWWEPEGKQLVTQWRTTPRVVDWDGDGLPDLVMLNHQGYLCLYRRARRDGRLLLLPPERIFLDPGGRFLYLAAGHAGRSGRRKIDLVDWDGDGDLDLLTDGDAPIWYENIGSRQKPVMRLRGPLLKTSLGGHNATPIGVDWDGDGRMDLLVGAQDGFFYYFERSYIDAMAAR